VLPYVFPVGRTLSELEEFGTEALTLDVVDEVNDYSAWGAADLSRLVSCCPNLFGFLDDPLHLLHGSHVSELHKLTGLTNLSVMYGAGDLASCQESMKGLAAITQLQSLSVDLRGTSSMTVATLLPLPSLTCLTSLHCCREAGLDIAEGESSLCYTKQVRIPPQSFGPLDCPPDWHKLTQHPVHWLVLRLNAHSVSIASNGLQDRGLERFVEMLWL
jgi:hypothetical protein